MWSCGTALNRTGSPHAVQPSVRDHTSEYAKAQRPPRKFLVQFFLPLESPGRYSKKKAKKRTGFSKRPGDASGEGNSECSNKTILATCTKEQLQFSGLALYCQCLFPFLSLGLFVDLT